MRRPPIDSHDEPLGLTDPSVTRRDFLGGAVLGNGAALLGMAAPGLLRGATPAVARESAGDLLGPDWTGPGASATTGARMATRTKLRTRPTPSGKANGASRWRGPSTRGRSTWSWWGAGSRG